MPSKDSPAPSEATSKASSGRRKWLWRLGEVVLSLILFTSISLWLSRHMLDSDTLAPASQLTRLGDRESLQLIWPARHERTLVYFFAPWCSVCRVSMPGLNLLQTDDQQLRVIVVALDWDNRQQVQQFIEDTGFSGEVLLGNDTVTAEWKITGYPSYYVVGKDGRILHADRGLSTPPGLWLRTHL